MNNILREKSKRVQKKLKKAMPLSNVHKYFKVYILEKTNYKVLKYEVD
jgi:hypothetical protein